MKHSYIIFTLLVFFLISCKEESNQQVILKPEVKVKQDKKPKAFTVNNIGDTLDVFNDVYIIYNESISNTSGRNLTKDGYNLGLKWQCVEFVKRYYHEHLNHKMPNSYGHAKDFFNPKLPDGKLNNDRKLYQYTNGSSSKPKVNDLLVFDGTVFNPYGHVAIVSKVGDDSIEIVQQNVGKNSRDNIKLKFEDTKWFIRDNSILGWLRKK